jgi:hypothetical protein
MSFENLVGQSLGQYELREVLGAGGMGAVYRAFQANLKREVAVKVLPPHLAQQAGYLERFTREAETAAALEHPHIVPIVDYGTQDGISYIVMRLLTGGTLAERLAQREAASLPPPSLGEIAELLKQIGSALDYAHSKGVIHRDIKPSNIMFDNHGNAYLVDFGIAKLLESRSLLTGTGMSMGTPIYMPPEQWRSELITPAADQYSLAVIAYAMVTGHVPFEADTPFALMHKHLNEDPTPINAWRSDVPQAVGLVLARAMSKKAEDRFPSCNPFAQAFEGAISGREGQMTGMFTFKLKVPPRPAPKPSTAPLPVYTPAEGHSMTITEGQAPLPPPAALPTVPLEQPRRNPLLWAVGLLLVAAVAGGGLFAAKTMSDLQATQEAVNQTQTAIPLIATATAAAQETAQEIALIATATAEEDAARQAAAQRANDAATQTAFALTAAANAAASATRQFELAATAFAEGLTATATLWTPTPTPTNTPTNTPTPTDTPTPTPTDTPTPTPTPTNTPTPSPTPIPTTVTITDIAVIEGGAGRELTVAYNVTEVFNEPLFMGASIERAGVVVEYNFVPVSISSGAGTALVTLSYTGTEPLTSTGITIFLYAESTPNAPFFVQTFPYVDEWTPSAPPATPTPTAGETGQLAYGDSVSQELVVEGSAFWTFEGRAGQAVNISVTSDQLGAMLIELYNPADEWLTTDTSSGENGLPSIVSYVLPVDGTYTLIVYNQDSVTGDYTIALNTVNVSNEGQLAYGTAQDNAVTDAYGDTWTFEGSAGDMIRIGIFSQNNDLNSILHLYDPNGVEVFFSYFSIEAYQLQATGTYRIMVRGQQADTGIYIIGLGVAQGNLAYGGSANGELARGDVHLWTFEANVGDVISIVTESRELDTYLVLYSSDGTDLVYNDNNDDGSDARVSAYLIPVSGVYAIGVGDSQGDSSGQYTISIDTPPAPLSGELRYGDTVAGEVMDTGGNWYTFEGSQGDTIILAMSGAREDEDLDCYLVLYGPDYSIVIFDDDNGVGGGAYLFATLPSSGTYVIVARTWHGGGGDYALSLTIGDTSRFAYATVNGEENITLYAGPGARRYGEAGTSYGGDAFVVIGRNGEWYQIGTVAGTEQWIEVDAVSIIGDAASIPQVDAP